MLKKTIILVAIAGSLGACNSVREERTVIGGALGAGAGAIVGGVATGTAGGALAGAAIGGVGGAIIGNATSPRGGCYDYNRYGERVRVRC